MSKKPEITLKWQDCEFHPKDEINKLLHPMDRYPDELIKCCTISEYRNCLQDKCPIIRMGQQIDEIREQSRIARTEWHDYTPCKNPLTMKSTKGRD